MAKETAAVPAPKKPATSAAAKPPAPSATKSPASSAAEVQRTLRAEIDGLRKDLATRLDQVAAMAEQTEAANRQAEAKLAEARTQLAQAREAEAGVALLEERHRLEITLLHALYASWQHGPATGVASFANQIAMIGDSDLFDASWYLTTYPDVATGSLTPKEHYVRSGAFEGRNPGPRFDTMAYYLANPDIARAGWPALVHYLGYGRAEGRAIG